MALSQFVSDPSQLTPTAKKKRPSFQFDFRSLAGGRTQIRRQTTEQANRPAVQPFATFTGATNKDFFGGPPQRALPAPTRFRTASLPAGFDFKASQFPFELRRGISSDASRQSAFRLGFGSGEGRTGFARRAPGQFFDPRFMFDRNFQRFRRQERLLRRRHGL